jgi:hypothetical protein
VADDGLLALLHGAVGRTTTLTAELRVWQHESRSRRAFEMARTAATIGAIGHRVGGPDVPDESEMVWQVVHAEGGRYRSDPIAESGAYTGPSPRGLQACDGERMWFLGSGTVHITRPHGSVMARRLLDPAWVLTHDLDVVGEDEASGRRVLRVRATARIHQPRSGGAADMAAERDLHVDAERGFLHADIALVDGEPYDVMELREVVLDTPVDPSTFRLEIPPGFKVFDDSQDPPRPSPWDRRRQWHVRWPIARW